MDVYSFKEDVIEQTCHRCSQKFNRHRESEVYVCFSCYEENVVRARTRKDIIVFALKMTLAVFLMIWAFFVYTSSKSGKKDAKLSGLIESLAAAGASVYVGCGAWRTFRKTKGVRRK